MQLDPSVMLNESRIFGTKFIPPLLLISFYNTTTVHITPPKNMTKSKNVCENTSLDGS